MFHRFTSFSFFIAFLLFGEVDAVLTCLGQGFSSASSRFIESIDTTGVQDEEGVEVEEVGWLLVTGATDAVRYPSRFYCRIRQKDVSIRRHGPHEILRHFQGSKRCHRSQRLWLETPSWHFVDYEGNPMAAGEMKRHWERTLRTPLVIRDRNYPYYDDIIAINTVAQGAMLPV